MTTHAMMEEKETCPAQAVLKMLSGKWKPEIFRLAAAKPVRFSGLLRSIEGANKQSISVALKELEEAALLQKTIIHQKPLHIEYSLSEKGKAVLPIFLQLEAMG